MADSWFLWVLAVALCLAMVLLVVSCVHCRKKGPLVSISQVNASDDYMLTPQFRVIHPSQPTLHINSGHTSSHLLSPFSDSGTQRHRSVTPTETESNPSYENPVDCPDYVNTDSDPDDPGYIIVLPGGEAASTNQSRASTPSSDLLHDYENVPEKKASSEDTDYLNVEPLKPLDLSAQSSSDTETEEDEEHGDGDDEDDDDDDDDDDDEGNYVNQPPMIHSKSSETSN